jgi:hypothetical protein
VSEDGDFEVSAALLRRGHDIPAMVSSLSDRLKGALPDHVEATRSRLRRASTLVVRLNPESFRLELHGRNAAPWIDHVVRGVCVRSEEIDFDTWLARLAAALDQEARRNTAIRLALEDALS